MSSRPRPAAVTPAGSPAVDRRVRAAVVMLAAGEGRRSGHSTNKVLLPLAGHAVLAWSVRSAAAMATITHLVLVVRESDEPQIEAALTREATALPVTLVLGGETRHDSEWHALQALAPVIEAGEVDVVLIHDAARPLATTALFEAVAEAAAGRGGAIPVREQPALIGIDELTDVPGRVVGVQTPQGFAAAPLLDAYRRAEDDGFRGSDTASCVERYTDLVVTTVDGTAANIKITFPGDVLLAERLLAKAGGPTTTRPAQPG